MRPSATFSRTAWGAQARPLLAAALLALTACGSGDPINPNQGVFKPTTLLDAVLVGDRAAVQQFVARGENVNAAETDGTTPLMRAIHGRFPEIAKTLIDAGADVSAINRYGVSALYLASVATDSGTARELLAAGADANTSLPGGETVLMTAAKAGDVAIVRALLASAGVGSLSVAPATEAADAGIAPSGYGAAAVAPSRRWNRADPNAKEGWYGQTALMWAAAAGHADVMRLLIAAGANVDEHSQLIDAPESTYERLERDFVYPRILKGRLTALHLAAREGELEAVQALIESGADLDAVDAAGTSALILATLNDHLEVTAALLQAGADPNVADTDGETLLLAAVDIDTVEATAPVAAAPIASDPSPLDIVALALAKGAEVNAANPAGDTPLHGATLRGSTAIIQVLVDHGAKVTAKNAKGQTPLDIAMGVPAERIPYNEATATLLRRLSLKG